MTISVKPRFGNLIKPHLRIKGRPLWVLIIAAFSMCAMASLAVRANKASAPADAGAVSASHSARSSAMPKPVMPRQASTPDAAELLILTPSGFVPNQITRPTGPFLLALIDRSGLDQITLQLNTSGGTNLHSTASQIEKAEASDIFDLQPGTYIYTESHHPEWTCTITITP